MICCYHTEAKGEMSKKIIPIFLCVALLLSLHYQKSVNTLLESLFIYGIQDTTAVDAGPA